MSEFANSQIAAERPWSARRLSLSYRSIAALVAASDWLLIVISNLIGDVLYQYFRQGGVETHDSFGIGGLDGLLFLFIANYCGLYRLPALLAPSRYLQNIVFAICSMCLMLTFILYLLHSAADVSRGMMIYFAFLVTVLISIFRLVCGSFLNFLLIEGAILGRRAVLIGEEGELNRITPPNLLYQFGFNEIARVSVSSFAGAASNREAEEKVAFAIRLAREQGAEEFLVAIAWNRAKLLHKVNEGLRASTLPVRLLPDHFVSTMMVGRLASASGHRVSIELQRAPLSSIERFVKRILDLILASVALALLWPIMTMAAVAIRAETPGPIFFRQLRTGFDGVRFKICKFRTMTVLEDGENVVQAKLGDRRVTRVGAFLRRTSIDELPQLYNVLKGDMSLVGPRPHAILHDQQYQRLISKYSFRFHVKPGITGWAQVSGLRGETSRIEEMEKRIESDLWYIDNWSFGLDLWILLRTTFEIVRNKAY